MSDGSGKVLALSGGIGGAKLALGLYRILPPDTLTVIANTGDDFEHLGLSISPDLDTVLYTLSGQDNPELGWGRRGETWNFMQALEALGGETWFRLGDGDLATHVERTRRLHAGEPLSAIMDDFRRSLGIGARLLPMSDQPVRTRLQTADGWLDFQDYFVRRHSAPVITGLAYAGIEAARPHPEILDLLRDPALHAVIVCPSNPLISIDPILAVPGLRQALRDCPAPVAAVSPLIGGKAVKGPTAKMMAELGMPVDAATVARHYRDILNIYVADEADGAVIGAAGLPMPTVLTQTLMQTLEDRERLAQHVLHAVDRVEGAAHGMSAADIWAVVPVKDTAAAKQRLAPAAPPAFRRALALAMLEDVLEALAAAPGLSGRLLVTTDAAAIRLADRYGVQCIEDGAADGHTGAVTAAGRRLAREGRGGMLTMPGDIPLVTAEEIGSLIAAHREAPAFTIAPSHDEQGSNAIILSPPDAVPLRFGDDSYFPHLAAAEARGIRPTIVHLPGIAFDIDNPADLVRFAALGSRTRAGRLVAANAQVIGCV